MKKVLTIAGSDCSGGAGVQADLKTMTAHGVYGMSAFAMLTAQNTTGIQEVFDLPPAFLAAQIDSCCTDIMPNATKTGALFDAEKIHVTAEKIKQYNLKNVVIDPVMVCTANGGVTNCLLRHEAVENMIKELFSVADIITPNFPETTVLVEKITGKSVKIDSREKMEECAKILAETVKNQCVLVKGGHFSECSDCLYFDGKITWFEGKKIDTKNTHGTGCTLSSAIASNLALGFDMIESVKNAKDYVYNAILNDPKIGHGNGPVNHCWNIK